MRTDGVGTAGAAKEGPFVRRKDKAQKDWKPSKQEDARRPPAGVVYCFFTAARRAGRSTSWGSLVQVQ